MYSHAKDSQIEERVNRYRPYKPTLTTLDEDQEDHPDRPLSGEIFLRGERMAEAMEDTSVMDKIQYTNYWMESINKLNMGPCHHCRASFYLRDWESLSQILGTYDIVMSNMFRHSRSRKTTEEEQTEELKRYMDSLCVLKADGRIKIHD
jgi:hypothetical protein